MDLEGLFFVSVPFCLGISMSDEVKWFYMVLSSIQFSLQVDLGTEHHKTLRMDLPFGHALARDGSGSTSLA